MKTLILLAGAAAAVYFLSKQATANTALKNKWVPAAQRSKPGTTVTATTKK